MTAVRDELTARIRSLSAERQRPVPEHREHLPKPVEALMAELIGVLAGLLAPQNPTRENYDWLRSQGLDPYEAAYQIGICADTRRRYETDRMKGGT